MKSHPLSSPEMERYQKIKNYFKPIYIHNFVFLVQRSHVFKWDGRLQSKWTKFDDVKVELPMETIVEVEVVQELRGEVSI